MKILGEMSPTLNWRDLNTFFRFLCDCGKGTSPKKPSGFTNKKGYKGAGERLLTREAFDKSMKRQDKGQCL